MAENTANDSGDPSWLRGRLRVVVNDEDQYSVWPCERQPPAGWRDTGVCGTKAECLAHIEEIWTDMRPRSIRNQ